MKQQFVKGKGFFLCVGTLFSGETASSDDPNIGLPAYVYGLSGSGEVNGLSIKPGDLVDLRKVSHTEYTVDQLSNFVAINAPGKAILVTKPESAILVAEKESTLLSVFAEATCNEKAFAFLSFAQLTPGTRYTLSNANHFLLINLGNT